MSSHLVLTAEQEAIAQRVAQLVAPVKPGPILTLAEAIAYTKHESDSAFYRWAGRWKITSTSNGRYARGHLDRALAREASQRGRANRKAA
jgi:hypothetical protein